MGGTAGAFDLGAACSGFVYALAVGSQFVQTGLHDRVHGHRRRHPDPLRRLHRSLDLHPLRRRRGRGVLEATDEPRGLLSTVLGADGAGYKHLYIPGWGAFVPESAELFPEYRPYLHMNGQEVFRFAVRVMGDAAVEAVAKGESHLRRRRHAHSAPGQHAHHRRRGAAARPAAGEGLGQSRPLRQYLGGLDPDRPVRSGGGREAGGGGQRRPRRLRRRVGLGGRHGALGNGRRLPRSGVSPPRPSRARARAGGQVRLRAAKTLAGG